MTPEKMTEEEKKELRDFIQSEIGRLKESIGLAKNTVQPVAPDNAIGRLTRMEAINSKSINEATLNSAKIKLGRLEKALRDLEEPDFGICVRCEEPIPFGRLMILPESTVCVKCIEG